MCSRSGVTATAAIRSTSAGPPAPRCDGKLPTSGLQSYRALALAADDLERLVAVPVDELVQCLEVELRREGELLDLVHEPLLADPRRERVELLARLTLVLVHAQPAFHRLGDALGRQPDLEPGAVGHLTALVLTADVGDVGGDSLAASLDRRAVETDVGDVVLGAAVRAAAHLDVDPLGQRIPDLHRLDPLLNRLVEPHRARDAELARVGARAAHHVAYLVRAGVAEPLLEQPLPDVVDRLVAHPAQHQVLLHAGARVAAREVAHDLRQAPELLGAQVATWDLHLDGREARLALRADVRGHEPVELARVAVRAAVADRRRRNVLLLVVLEQLGRVVALGDPVAPQLHLDLTPELVDAELVHEDLDPGPGAVLAQPVLAIEDPQHRLRDLDVLAVVGAHELVQGGCNAGHDRGAAAHPEREAALAVLDPRDVADVVDPGDRPVLVRRGVCRLDLAWHRLGGRMAHEVAHVRARIGGGVEELALGHPGPGVAGHVADRVAATLAGREVRVAQLADRLGGVVERHVVHLDILPGGDVALDERCVLLDHVREGLHLLRSDAPEGELRADHLNVRLALAVDALPEAEGDERVLSLPPAEELARLGVEVVELPLQDRDHVTRHVLQDLRVLERALPALGLAGCGRRFHGGAPLCLVRVSSGQCSKTRSSLGNYAPAGCRLAELGRPPVRPWTGGLDLRGEREQGGLGIRASIPAVSSTVWVIAGAQTTRASDGRPASTKSALAAASGRRGRRRERGRGSRRRRPTRRPPRQPCRHCGGAPAAGAARRALAVPGIPGRPPGDGVREVAALR